MAWLISILDPDLGDTICVGLSYSFAARAFYIQCLGDYGWTEDDLAGMGAFCDRLEIVDTEMAKKIFALTDEIWLHDPHVIEFVDASIRSPER